MVNLNNYFFESNEISPFEEIYPVNQKLNYVLMKCVLIYIFLSFYENKAEVLNVSKNN